MEKLIQEFLANKKLAVIGVSRNNKKWGNEMLRLFIKNNYEVYPVSNNAEQAEGIQCFKNAGELPSDVRNLIISIPKPATQKLLESIEKDRFDIIWFVYGSQNKEILDLAIQKNIRVIYGYCPMMFLNRTGLHKFHYIIKRAFSKTEQ